MHTGNNNHSSSSAPSSVVSTSCTYQTRGEEETHHHTPPRSTMLSSLSSSTSNSSTTRNHAKGNVLEGHNSTVAPAASAVGVGDQTNKQQQQKKMKSNSMGETTRELPSPSYTRDRFDPYLFSSSSSTSASSKYHHTSPPIPNYYHGDTLLSVPTVAPVTMSTMTCEWPNGLFIPTSGTERSSPPGASTTTATNNNNDDDKKMKGSIPGQQQQQQNETTAKVFHLSRESHDAYANKRKLCVIHHQVSAEDNEGDKKPRHHQHHYNHHCSNNKNTDTSKKNIDKVIPNHLMSSYMMDSLPPLTSLPSSDDSTFGISLPPLPPLPNTDEHTNKPKSGSTMMSSLPSTTTTNHSDHQSTYSASSSSSHSSESHHSHNHNYNHHNHNNDNNVDIDEEAHLQREENKREASRMVEKLMKSSNSTPWSERLKDLLIYKSEFGDCLVPQKYSKNQQLGSWVNKQRVEYKLMQEGKRSSMTKERIHILEKVGFMWSKNLSQPSWDSKFRELEKYKLKHGDCLVPTKYPKFPSLGRWVSTQRAQYKIYKEGGKSAMTEERVKRLEAIGFVWRLHF